MKLDYNKAQQKVAKDSQVKKERFKLYKVGRLWVAAGLVTLTFGTVGLPVAQAAAVVGGAEQTSATATTESATSTPTQTAKTATASSAASANSSSAASAATQTTEPSDDSSGDVATKASAATLTITYVDKDDADKEITTDTVNGTDGESGTYTVKPQNNYQLATGQADSIPYTLNADDSDNITVELAHVHTTGTAQTTNTVKYAGTANSDLAKASVTNVKWTSDTDKVTGVTTWTADNATTSITSPTVTGLTPDKKTVEFNNTSATNVEPTDQTQIVTYIVSDHSFDITSVDEDGRTFDQDAIYADHTQDEVNFTFGDTGHGKLQSLWLVTSDEGIKYYGIQAGAYIFNFAEGTMQAYDKGGNLIDNSLTVTQMKEALKDSGLDVDAGTGTFTYDNFVHFGKITLTYQATAKVTYNYVDSVTGKTVASKVINGYKNDTGTYTEVIPANYHKTDGTAATSHDYTLNSLDNQVVNVPVTQDTTTTGTPVDETGDPIEGATTPDLPIDGNGNVTVPDDVAGYEPDASKDVDPDTAGVQVPGNADGATDLPYVTADDDTTTGNPVDGAGNAIPNAPDPELPIDGNGNVTVPNDINGYEPDASKDVDPDTAGVQVAVDPDGSTNLPYVKVASSGTDTTQPSSGNSGQTNNGNGSTTTNTSYGTAGVGPTTDELLPTNNNQITKTATNLTGSGELPQTGAANESFLVAAGVGILSLLGLFGLGKKRHHDYAEKD
ncbi:KxYKxGKxW signal peptide domain-containing protein [Loigolactobacillus zhaoyuanensis]|uniref:KxYKxGKxW signal peptide domain-containing protein n=1 Tax=Loigolactobacillus zhaoyuanensis TaxID=2486017 RepID=UPI000F736F6D|nr:KxYKxGKxW signal peptide domain-containing protein [Loigolactobacillus zhaoyuanensis]